MRKLVFVPLLFLALSTVAAESAGGLQIGEPLLLQNGSYLFIGKDLSMRMVDREGKPITMKEGVEMKLKDGGLIMMKNKRLWRHDHRLMK